MDGVAPRGWRQKVASNTRHEHTREVVRQETLSPEAMAVIANLHDRLTTTEAKLAALFEAIQAAGGKP